VVTLRVDSVLYTGTFKGNVKQEKFERTIKAGTAQNITMPVTYKEYAAEDILSDQSSFNIACLASVKETDFEFFSQDDFRVRKPDIAVKVFTFYNLLCVGNLVNLFLCSIFKARKEVPLGETFDVTCTLKNPLPVALNRAKFVVEGAGLGVPHKVALGGPVSIGQEARIVVKMTAAKAGQRTIGVKFYSDELNDVDGFLVIDVTGSDSA